MTAYAWCKRNGIAFVHFLSISSVINNMTLFEASAQYNCMTAEWKGDQAAGWDKVKHLYSEQMGWRDDDIKIWGLLLGKRLSEEQADD